MVAGGGAVTSSAGFAAVPCGGDSTHSSPVTAADTTAMSNARKPSDTRRSNKPIMEKRRRARINNCLNELKTLILDAMKKDPARHSKLEKADILEMTVKHLEQMQRQQVALSLAADPLVMNKFRAGFNECAGEVGRFPGLDPPVRRRLLQHLANCLNSTLLGSTSPAQDASNVQLHILPTTLKDASLTINQPTNHQNSGIFLSTTNSGSLQLVPTRLPNGDIALILPTNFPIPQSKSSSPTPSSTSSSPPPLLLPKPAPSERIPKGYEVSSTNYFADPDPEPTDHLKFVEKSNLKTHRMSPYKLEKPQSSSPTNLSRTSPTSFDRLSVNIPSSQTLPFSNDAATSPVSLQSNGSYPSPLSPSGSSSYGTMSPTRCYSPPSHKPLSLVIKRESIESMDEDQPWRPW
ncbi:unnamed protein product [Bemisia tabaci]|uniref:Hairy n=1 Tax=Bemisia tabaci TaxID=7038 RepID=A0A9P0A4Z5_BEMTA|nr:unnamed protein product [Bemisia tabaci]